MQLRPYQIDLVAAARVALSKHNRILLQAPTGAGKTAITVHMMKLAKERGKSAWFIVHQNELIKQTAEALWRQHLEHGLIVSGKRKSLLPSQVASVQTLVRRLDDYDPPDLIIIDECFSPDTEILTARGFIRFDELKDERIGQYDKDTKQISFVSPTRKIIKNATDGLLKVKSGNNFDLMVTPKHDMLINGEKIKADSVVSANYNQIPISGYACGDDNTLTPFEKFLICYQADGSKQWDGQQAFSTSFTFSKDRKIKEFLAMVDENGFKIHEVKCTQRVNCSPRRRFIVWLSHAVNKSVEGYFDIEKLGYRKCIDIIEYMNHWDGHVAAKNSYLYTTTNQGMADFYQTVAIMAGHKTKLVKVTDDRSETFSDVYRLFIVKNRMSVSTQHFKPEKIAYDGLVYCVEVDKGYIVTRRGGKVIVTGNCHRAAAATYLKVLEAFPCAKVIGLTATPERTDGKGLGDIFDGIVCGIGVTELIELGFLCDYEIFAPPSCVDMLDVKKTAGDFDKKQTEAAVDKATITGDAIGHYKTHASGKRCVVMCVTIKHAEHVAELYNAQGITAAAIHGTLTETARTEILEKFGKGEIKVVTNVQLLIEGVDIPSIEVVQWLRPTHSLIVWLQGIGRGLRPCDGKERLIILDHVGNVHRHGLPDNHREWTLDGAKARKRNPFDEDPEIKLSQCGKCFAHFRSGVSACPACGEPVNVKSKAELEIIEGELLRIEREQEKQTKRRDQGSARTIRALVELGVRREMDHPDGWAARTFAGREKRAATREELHEARAILTEIKEAG